MRSCQIGDDNHLTREGEEIRKEGEYLKKKRKHDNCFHTQSAALVDSHPNLIKYEFLMHVSSSWHSQKIGVELRSIAWKMLYWFVISRGTYDVMTFFDKLKNSYHDNKDSDQTEKDWRWIAFAIFFSPTNIIRFYLNMRNEKALCILLKSTCIWAHRGGGPREDSWWKRHF